MLEKIFEKNFGEVVDPFELPHERIFLHLEKNGVLKFLEEVHHPGLVIHDLLHKRKTMSQKYQQENNFQKLLRFLILNVQGEKSEQIQITNYMLPKIAEEK